MLNNTSGNINCTFKNTVKVPAFSGKKFVQMNLHGEKYLVPKAAADTRRCVKQTVFHKSTDSIWVANAVNLKNNIFLGVAHILDDFTQNIASLGVGKNCNREIFMLNQVDKFKPKSNLDLALFEVNQIEREKFFAQSNPIKVAEKMPELNEDVYISAYHNSYNGPKIIPAKFLGECSQNVFQRFKLGREAKPYEAYSQVIDDKINPSTLSGGSIINANGELIGIQKAAYIKQNNKSNGNIYFIGIEDIKTFLREHNVFAA